MKNMWLDWRPEDLRTLGEQLCDEGCEIQTVEHEFLRLQLSKYAKMDAGGYPLDAGFQEEVNKLMDKCQNLPMRFGYRYFEPSELKAIKDERRPGPRVFPRHHSEAEIFDHILAAWLGRCVGCLLGKPSEGTRRAGMQKFLDRFDLKEITDYFWRMPGLTKEDCEGFNPWQGEAPWGYRNIDFYIGDDDTNFTVMAMAIFKQYGLNFTPSNVAEFWLANMPHMATCTAERVAYRNFLNGISPPLSATVRNPYREWIGGQIRADFFGYVALGRPELAAEMAWRDASISHVKNGIYGAMWVAAMLSMAMGETDVRRLIEIGLSQVPEASRFVKAIREILTLHKAGVTYTEMVDYIHRRWDENNAHHWCHVISNAQIVAIGLLYSEGDYEKAITRTVLCCFDTDCNGATVGSIMGMMLGSKALPEKWTGIMNDTMHADVKGYDKVKISAVAEEMFQLHLKLEETLKS
jgi:ADP-ribosylglycohydrolase